MVLRIDLENANVLAEPLNSAADGLLMLTGPITLAVELSPPLWRGDSSENGVYSSKVCDGAVSCNRNKGDTSSSAVSCTLAPCDRLTEQAAALLSKDRLGALVAIVVKESASTKVVKDEMEQFEGQLVDAESVASVEEASDETVHA